jgi:L-rhamnose-H+ transport protein
MLSNPLLGVLLHAVGATSAAFCYTPQKGTRGWSWQTYWLAQASICWFALPLFVAWLTIPELGKVLAEAPASAMRNAFLLGAFYGIGGTAFGLAIKHIGFSLTYAIAIGISCVLGTLLPPIVAGQLGELIRTPGSEWVFAGMGIGVAGIFLSGLAGRFKESDLDDDSGSFNLAKGLPLCMLAGVLSAVYGFSLAAGQPIADAAARYGAGQYEGNVIYIFSNSGAFLTTLLYCAYLHRRDRTIGEYFELPEGTLRKRLTLNFGLALLTGCLWYGQFFFYGLGHTRMGEFKFSSWGIHMIMLVLISATVGLIFKEWKGCRPRTKTILVSSLAILILAVLALTYGSLIGQTAVSH